MYFTFALFHLIIFLYLTSGVVVLDRTSLIPNWENTRWRPEKTIYKQYEIQKNKLYNTYSSYSDYKKHLSWAIYGEQTRADVQQTVNRAILIHYFFKWLADEGELMV